MLVIGIDSGSTTTKGVLFDGQEILKKIILPTTHNPRHTIKSVYDELRGDKEIYTVTTGYGRDLLPNANKKITEITCHGKGAAFLAANVGAVIDIGGQDSKVILMDRDGNIIDFLMNDKCAAGTGRFVEVIMKLLHQNIENLDTYVDGYLPVKISSMCTVFAESEVISMLAENEHGGAIALGIINSICDRTANFAKRLPLERTIFFSGGLAKSAVTVSLLESKLGFKVVTHPLSQFTGAIGAAVIASKKIK